MTEKRRPRPGIQPETYRPPPPIPRPNIRSIDPHKECWRLDHSGAMTWWGRPGDVKRCQHGRIMVRCEVGPHSRIAGPGTDYWRELSPIFDPIKYRRARKALA
jgi:hypothetical protein